MYFTAAHAIPTDARVEIAEPIVGDAALSPSCQHLLPLEPIDQLV